MLCTMASANQYATLERGLEQQFLELVPCTKHQFCENYFLKMQMDSRRALTKSLGENFYQKNPPVSAESAASVDIDSLLLMIQQNPDLKNFLLASMAADESTKEQQMQN